jgi:hypothetical protein
MYYKGKCEHDGTCNIGKGNEKLYFFLSGEMGRGKNVTLNRRYNDKINSSRPSGYYMHHLV